MKAWFALFVLQFLILPNIFDSYPSYSQDARSDLSPTVEMERKRDELTLNWGPHPNTGYQLSINDSYEDDNGWNVVYSLSYPTADDQQGILHTRTHPQATATVPEDVENVNLIEEKNGKTFEQLSATDIHESDTWNLDFDQDLRDDPISISDYIYVLDENNDEQDIIILVSSPSQIIVLPPAEGYEYGELYQLYIAPSLENDNGDSLEQGYKQPFYIGSETDRLEWQPPNPIEDLTLNFDGPSEEEETSE